MDLNPALPESSIDQRIRSIQVLGEGQRIDPAALQQLDSFATQEQGEFTKGLRRFGYSVGPTMQAFAGALAAPVAPEFAREQAAQANESLRSMPSSVRPKYNTFDEAKAAGVGGMLDYAAGAAGEGLPSTAMSLAGGLGGRAVGALAGRAGLGQAIGAIGTMLPMEGGETALELNNNPQAMANTTPLERAGLVLGRGAVNSALENVVPQMLIAPRLLGEATKIGRGLGNAVRNVGLLGAEGAVGEYGTEFAQDLTGQYVMNRAVPGTGYDFGQANEAGIKGAITGGITGGVGGGVQGVYSNLPELDKRGSEDRGSKGPKFPTLDGVIGTLRDLSGDPVGFAKEVGSATLEQLGAMAEGAGVLRQAAGKGLESGGELVGNLKSQLDNFIVDNIKDPANREWYAEQTSKLGTMGVAQYRTLVDSLQAETGKEFVEGLGAAARMTADGAASTGRGAFNWLRGVITGQAQAQATDPNAPKSSVFTGNYDENQRKDILSRVGAVNPSIEAMIKKASINDRRTLANTLLSLTDNASYLNNDTGSQLKAKIIEGWKAETGTDLNNVLEAAREGRRAAQMQDLVSEPLDKFMVMRDVAPKYKGTLEALAMKQTYDELTPVEKRLLTTLSKKDPANKADTGDRDRGRTYHAELVKMVDQRMRDAEGPAQTGNTGRIVEDSQYYTPEVAAADAAERAAGGTPGQMVDGEFVNAERVNGSPFNTDAFRGALVNSQFAKRADTTIPVTLSSDRLNAQQIAQLFGKKVKGQDRQDTIVGLTEDELSKINPNGPYQTAVNPMSLANMVRSPGFRERFAGQLSEYNGDANQQAVQNLMTSLAILNEQGIEIDPTELGLPPGDPIRIKANVDLNTLAKRSDLVVGRKGGQNITLRDALGQNRGPSQEAMLERLDQFGDNFTGSMEKLRRERNKSRVADKLYRAIYSATARQSETRPTNEQLDEAVQAYAKELGGQIWMRDTLNGLSDALRSGDLSIEQVRQIGEYYTGSEAVSFKDVLKLAAGLINGKGALRRADPMAEEFGYTLLDMADNAEAGQAGYEAVQTGDFSNVPTDTADEQLRTERGQDYQRTDVERTNRLIREATKTGNTEPTKGQRPVETKTEAPKTEAPAPEAPKTETPATEAPATEAKTEQPAEPPKPPTPPNDNKGGDDEKPPVPPDTRKRIVDMVRKMLGDRIAVVFDAKLSDPKAVGEYQNARKRLEALRDERRELVDSLKEARSNKDEQLVSELRDKLARLSNEEKKLISDNAVLGVIRIATGREETAGLVEHEILHAAFEILFTPSERAVLVTAFQRGLVRRRLQQYFKDHPDVLAAIDADSEEAAAYGFQVWMSDPDVLKVGPNVQGLFERVMSFIRKLLGVMSPAEKAELILSDLATGRRAETKMSPLAKQLDKDLPWDKRAQEFVKDMGGVLKAGYDRLFTSTYQRLQETENPALVKVAEAGYTATGRNGNRMGFVQREMNQTMFWRNKMENVLKGLTPEQMKAFQEARILDVRPTDPKVAAVFDASVQFFKDIDQYQRDAGVEMGNLQTKDANYYPLQFDPELVNKNREAFIKMLEKYPEQLETLKKTPDEIWNGITAYLDRGEQLVNVMGKNNEPVSAHVRTRSLDFISRADRLAFMSDDPLLTMYQYVKQAVRQAEFVRAYGSGGSELSNLLNEAKEKYGATDEQVQLARDYVNGLLGNKEVGMSRELKDLYGAMTVYQNYRLLPFALFSSLVDPLGIAVRSNSIGDAWEAFSYSIKNLFREWKKEYTPDQWEQMAEDLGIIAQHGTMVSTDALYTGVTLRGTTAKLNEALFKYNLLDGWIRKNTIMAVKAAQRFMLRSSQDFFGAEQSQRYLEELGLTKDDIMKMPGEDRIATFAEDFRLLGMGADQAAALEEKIRNATDKFVRQALLNPTAAELPNWASNPYLAPLAHLKSFVFAFNATILDRLVHEANNGNYRPIMIAAMYVPGMVAADMLKDFISNAGEEPPYKKGWGFADYVLHGADRSGLTGVSAFFGAAKEDLMRGGNGFESALGPTFGQGQKLARAFATGSDTQRWNALVDSMPLKPVYDQWLKD